MSTLGLMFRINSRVADIKTLFFLISFIALTGIRLVAAPPAPLFTNAEKPMKEQTEQSLPYLTLTWALPAESTPDPAIQFEVQVAESEDFSDATVHYRGPDRASFVSGLAEGDYYFRVRSFRDESEASPWSSPVSVKVQYKSLGLALSLFGIGAVVSVATIALVVTGDRRTRREEAAVQ